MGAALCTDVVPFTLDDIILIPQKVSKSHLAHDVSPVAVDHFSKFQNNLKAFTFRHRDSSASVNGAAARFDPSHVSALPMDLSQAKIELDDTRVYVLVQVQRQPVSPRNAPTGKATLGSPNMFTPRTLEYPLKDCDMNWRWNDVSPSWASVLSDVFTPRGLATPFSTNIGKPPASLSHAGARLFSRGAGCGTECGDGYNYYYSIYILNGVRAHPSLAAVAAVHAGRLEQALINSKETLQCLFFNCNPSRGEKEAAACGREDSLCASIGDVVGSRRPSRRTSFMGEEYQRNAILRSLLSLRKPAPTASVLGTTPTGGRSQENSSRGKSKRQEGAVLYSFEQYQQQKLKGDPLPLPTTKLSNCLIPPITGARPDVESSARKLPPLETIRSKQSVTDAGGAVKESPLPFTARFPNRTANSQVGSERGPSSAASPCLTPKSSSFMSPRFPVISALRLDGALRQQAGDGGLNDSQINPEHDEIRITEEKLQKLKASSPEATEILPWLFVGGEEAARDRSQLLAKGITSVVNTVAFSIENAHEDIFSYLRLNVSDSPDEPIFSLFPVVNQYIEEARLNGGKTFVHCHQGVSRSCSFVIAYVMWYEGLCYEKAYDYVRARRTVCSPNPGFYVSLLLWQDQLARPVLDKAYAYVPYPDYLFPFSYRLALVFRRQKEQQNGSEEGVHIMNQSVRVLDDKCDEFAMDPRLCYGFLLSGCPTPGGSQEPCTVSHFFVGPECAPAIGQQAKEEWEKFVKYSFYHGTVKTTVNNKGECITYTPLPPLQHPVECLLTPAEVVSAVDSNVYKRGETSCGTLRRLTITLVHDSCWDSLLSRSDMVELFTKYVAEVKQQKQAMSGHKRLREKEQQRDLGKLDVGKSKSSPTPREPIGRSFAASSARVGSHRSLQPRRNEPIEHTVESYQEEKNEGVAERETGGTTPVSHEMEIFAYPFTGTPVRDIIDATDMEAERAYVIILPRSSSGFEQDGRSSPSHRVFIWIGSRCGIEADEAMDAYRASLKSGNDVRLATGAVLKNPVEEVVYDGEEPDELLLALD